MNYRFVTLAGHRFSRAHNCILEVYARSRKYTSNIWIPSAVAELLQLSLKHVNDIGVRLCFDDTITCVYYHISQFQLDEVAIQSMWREFEEKHIHSMPLHCSPVASTHSSHSLTLSDEHHEEAHEELEQWLPRNTNGERFDHATEQQILSKFDLKTLGSCYWVTPDEANGIYNAPLHSTVLKEQRLMVEVPLPLCVFPVKYYHCSGSTRPEIFTTETCRRYDPYNFYGNFYKTKIAVRMKRYALRHGCLHAPRWITLARVNKFGCSVKEHHEPFMFNTSQNKSCQLVNIDLTSNPEYLERQALEWSIKVNQHVKNKSESTLAPAYKNVHMANNTKVTKYCKSSETTITATPHPLALTLHNGTVDHKESTDDNNVYAYTNAVSISFDNNTNECSATAGQDAAVRTSSFSTQLNDTNKCEVSCTTKEYLVTPSTDLYQRNLERVRNSISKLNQNMKVSIT